MLGRLLVGAAVAWPLVAGAATWHRASGATEPVWATLVYATAGQVCHQRPERSFHTHNTSWPVCARCSGLYLAAPFAAVVALWRPARRRLKPVMLFTAAALPTAMTLVWEWSGLGTPSNLVRFVTALPLGAVVAYILVATVTERGPSRSIG